MEFIDWPLMATFAGALAMVFIITQTTKNIGIMKKIPTQLLSYIIALAVLYPAYYFTNKLNASNAVLILFNGMLVALSANGSFDIVDKLLFSLRKDNTNNQKK